MKVFIGRNAELNFLKQHYEREGSRLLVVYGSRGVGKTSLLQEFCEDKQYSYYLARACSDREQRWQWCSELKEQGRSLTTRYPEYEELFETVLPAEKSEKQVLVIDEFHHMVKGGDFFERILGFMKEAGKRCPMLVILCSSASGWVENSMVSKIGSLATAINGFLKVREFGLQDMQDIFPEFSAKEALKTYAVLGGVPGYWKSFDPTLTLRENLICNVLGRESRLFGEMSLFMEQELREPAIYNTILTAMARECNKLNDIYKHTGFSRAKISVYLKNLMELDLVEKVYSVETAGWENAQKGVYRIRNPYVRFYYRYLFPNQSLLQRVSAEEFYEEKIAASFDNFAEEAYRKICREEMAGEFKSVGEWLGKSGSLDCVATDADGTYTVAMCSYAKEMTAEDLEWLLFTMKQAKLSDVQIRFYSEKGFSEELRDAAEADGISLRRVITE